MWLIVLIRHYLKIHLRPMISFVLCCFLNGSKEQCMLCKLTLPPTVVGLLSVLVGGGTAPTSFQLLETSIKWDWQVSRFDATGWFRTTVFYNFFLVNIIFLRNSKNQSYFESICMDILISWYLNMVRWKKSCISESCLYIIIAPFQLISGRI